MLNGSASDSQAETMCELCSQPNLLKHKDVEQKSTHSVEADALSFTTAPEQSILDVDGEASSIRWNANHEDGIVDSSIAGGVVAEETDHEENYPGPLALFLLTVGLCLSVFLVSLDRTIIAQAIPRITDEFHSYDDVGWYGSSYLITASALQPTYGRVFLIFNIKWSFLIAMAVFEIGSLICGIAPNSVTLIIGRAIAGWGSAGILTGSFVVVAHSVPLRNRPVYSAAVGIMFGIGAFVGPILGGVFTDLVSWRWCFYFNIPVGSVTVIAMLFFFKPKKNITSEDSFLKKIFGLDLLGNGLLLASAIMLFLALQYNDLGYAWSSARVIGLLVGFIAVLFIFMGWQRYQGDRALMPPNIMLQRTVFWSCVAAFFIYGTLLVHAYYLPIWFQAIKGDSAISSGISMMGYVLPNALFSLFAGAIVTKIGYFAPPAIIGSAIGVVGCGLLTTLQVDTRSANWIGYEILASAGLGIAIQQGFIAVQTVLTIDQIPIGVAAVACFQSLGGSVFVSVANTILQDELLSASQQNELPGVDIQQVIALGATQFRSIVSKAALPGLLVVYNEALRKVFYIAVPLAGLSCFAAFGLEWKSVRNKKIDFSRSNEEPSSEANDSEAVNSSEKSTSDIELNSIKKDKGLKAGQKSAKNSIQGSAQDTKHELEQETEKESHDDLTTELHEQREQQSDEEFKQESKQQPENELESALKHQVSENASEQKAGIGSTAEDTVSIHDLPLSIAVS